MSENAGCVWLFAILVAGIVTLMISAQFVGDKVRSDETERYRVCVENGGTWDGFWKSCGK